MENKDIQAAWWQPALVLFIKMSGWIAGPIVVALFFGKWLDRKFGSAPWFFLICIGAAFIFSSIGIVKQSKTTMKKIIENEKRKKENKSENN